MSTIEQRLETLGLKLPALQPVIGSYRLTKRSGDTVYVSGHVSLGPHGLIAGKVGADVSLERAREAARLCALHMLASLRAELGTLSAVTSILKVFGMVDIAPGFGDLAGVLNGATDLLVEVFGEPIGLAARAAVGMSGLPLGASVETEMIVAAAPLTAVDVPGAATAGER